MRWRGSFITVICTTLERNMFFFILIAWWALFKPLTKLTRREWFVGGTVERCGHPLPWKRLNLHEYLSWLGWILRWQACHLICFMPITRYNKCHERVNEMYRLVWGIFPDLICCDGWRGHCLEDECWPSELLLTNDLKRTLNRHNLVNWAAVGGKQD